jgi:phosphate transport system substrate-binding protein
LNKFIYSIVIGILILILRSCSPGPSPALKPLRIKGSDTMLPLLENLAVVYMAINPGVSIYAEGGGTAVGISALINGETDICSASRLLLPHEVSLISQRYRSVGIYSIIAKDAVSIYVHPDNPVKNLTLKQLKQIFTGEIKNWSVLEGPDIPIQLFIRPPTSGTYLYLKEHLLQGEEFDPEAHVLPTTAQVIASISRFVGGIGFGGIAYGKSITHCTIDGIPPTKDNVRYNLYPLSRYLYFYTIRKPRGLVKDFMDWVMSKKGQALVRKLGYISLWSDNTP